MSDEDETDADYYQTIAGWTLEEIDEDVSKVLIYLVVHEGVTQAEAFFTRPGKPRPKYMTLPEDISEKAYEFWEHWRSQPGNPEWRQASMVVADGRFAVEFQYPNDFDAKAERGINMRDLALEKVFGTTDAEYPPAPSGGWTLKPKG